MFLKNLGPLDQAKQRAKKLKLPEDRVDEIHQRRKETFRPFARSPFVDPSEEQEDSDQNQVAVGDHEEAGISFEAHPASTTREHESPSYLDLFIGPYSLLHTACALLKLRPQTSPWLQL